MTEATEDPRWRLVLIDDDELPEPQQWALVSNIKGQPKPVLFAKRSADRVAAVREAAVALAGKASARTRTVTA